MKLGRWLHVVPMLGGLVVVVGRWAVAFAWRRWPRVVRLPAPRGWPLL